MLSVFEKKVADFIKANGLFESADKILLAVSGGADSTALLYLLHNLKKQKIIRADLICAHINHQLRDHDADLDENFVIDMAHKLNCRVITNRLDVRGFAEKNKLSLETAARRLRIEALLGIAKTENCNCVATAHHSNDNAETILHRLIRGAGFRGLAGIRPVQVFDDNISFIRPFLSVTRAEIIQYLQKRNLKWRTDHTNADCRYTRNFIRHCLLPALQQDCSGSLVEQLSALAESARKFYTLICDFTEKIWPTLANCSETEINLNLKNFLNQPNPVKIELLRRCLNVLGSGQGDITQRHFKKLLQLAENNVTGKKLELPDGFVVYREYGKLIFSPARKSEIRSRKAECRNLSSVLCPLSSVVLEIPGQTVFGRYLIETTVLDSQLSMPEKHEKTKSSIENRESRIRLVEWFDLEKLKLPLEARYRKAGDRFWPLGLKAEKKVGKFLTDAKVPQEMRNKILVVTDTEKIVWLWPIRMSEQTKITEKTKKILQLQITNSGISEDENRAERTGGRKDG